MWLQKYSNAFTSPVSSLFAPWQLVPLLRLTMPSRCPLSTCLATDAILDIEKKQIFLKLPVSLTTTPKSQLLEPETSVEYVWFRRLLIKQQASCKYFDNRDYYVVFRACRKPPKSRIWEIFSCKDQTNSHFTQQPCVVIVCLSLAFKTALLQLHYHETNSDSINAILWKQQLLCFLFSSRLMNRLLT